MSTKITNVCEKHGHSFVESSLGKGPTAAAAQTVTLFCQKCGEVKIIKQDQLQSAELEAQEKKS